MKRIATLFFFFLSVSLLHAQISVRMKDSQKGKEINVKTSSKQGTSKDAGAKPAAGETQTTPASDPKTATADTATRPAATADDTYNGPAKVQLKSFWRYMEKLRAGDKSSSVLGNAMRMLDQVKQADPKYDVSALEAEAGLYRSKAEAEELAKSKAAGKADAERNYYKDVWSKLVNIYSKGSIAAGGSGKAYYDRVQELNITEYQQKKASGAGGKGGKYIELIDEILADYDNFVKRADRLRWNVTEVLLKARNEPNPQEKMDLLTHAKYECEAVLVMCPDNAAFKQKLSEVNKLLGNADAEASKNYTSDFHKQNAGKIIWSNKPLVIGKEKEMSSSIKTEFKTGEAIFGTIYLGNKASQLMNGNDRIRVVIRVDKGTAIWGGDLSNIIIPLSVQDKTFIQFALLPDEAWFSSNYAPYIARENWTYSAFMDELVRAGDISHEITCKFMFPTNIQSDIEGALTLDLNGGSASIKSLATKLHDQLMASRTLPKAGMSNAAMEQQMVTAANNLGWKNTFLKAVITSSSWAIKKNELTGAVLYRYVDAVCTTKEYDGKCYYQEFSFRQDYTGGGYSNMIKYNGYGSKREIGCDKIK